MNLEAKYPDVHVKLSGESSNAFVIMGTVGKALKRSGVPAAEVEEYYRESKSGDFDNLIRTAMRWVDVL